jgi:hypothetical protein
MYVAHTSRHDIVVNVDPKKRQTVSIMDGLDVAETKNIPNTLPVDHGKRRLSHFIHNEQTYWAS